MYVVKYSITLEFAYTQNVSFLKQTVTRQVCHDSENIDQTLVNSLHGLLNFKIGRLDCRVITTE